MSRPPPGVPTWRRSVASFAAVAMTACAAKHPAVPAASRPAEAPEPVVAATGDLSDLRASLQAPARVPYDPQSVGAAGQFVSIRVENIGARVVSVARLHASFESSRDGVAFPCNAHVQSPRDAVEPSHLDPGQAFTFERLLDCSMPLPGRYDVRVWIHAADGQDEDRGRPAAGPFVGSCQVEVTATPSAPHPIPSHEGLFALMTGGPTLPPMPPEAWARGDYQVVVAVINGSPRPVDVGRSRFSLLVFKQGALMPCTGREQRLDEPDTLTPGAVHLVRVPVTCALTEEGRYAIVGRLAVGDGADVEIGRVGLLVTQAAYFVVTVE